MGHSPAFYHPGVIPVSLLVDSSTSVINVVNAGLGGSGPMGGNLLITRFTVGHVFRTCRIPDFLAGKAHIQGCTSCWPSPVSLVDINVARNVRHTFCSETPESQNSQKTLA